MPIENKSTVFVNRKQGEGRKRLHWLHEAAAIAWLHAYLASPIQLLEMSFDVPRLSKCPCLINRIRTHRSVCAATTKANTGSETFSASGTELLCQVRNSSLGLSSVDEGNLCPLVYENSGAESGYLLQQPAHECSLASPSGNQLRAEFPSPLPGKRKVCVTVVQCEK